MPTSVFSKKIMSAFQAAASPVKKQVPVNGQTVEIVTPFASPADWRDSWIYFLMVDRFNNPTAAPKQLPFDARCGDFQGGTLNGVKDKLPYLKDLGVGALWLTPVLKNCIYEGGSYHGYGIQDFVSIDPRLASDPQAAAANPELVENELIQLVDAAHALGMYVIFDIVLNHAGNVFGYVVGGNNNKPDAEYNDSGYPINWHDAQGGPGFSDFPHAPHPIPDAAAVWPMELQENAYFRRKGKGGEAGGDFESLKELVTAEFTVRETLIRAYQYLIARFDVDGYRIDTLKYVEPDFARTFGNSMREYALSIGKKNFFTFGEVYDGEEKIAEFIGRNAGLVDEPIGVDAALDFPLFFQLPGVVKGQSAPSSLAGMYTHRKNVQSQTMTSHGEAGKYFVTFLDNHDMKQRFYYRDPGDHHRYDSQVTLAVACLFSLQGVPCLYYGTEQGLHGSGGSDLDVREALWGRPGGFDPTHAFYQAIATITRLRNTQPSMRYGRQYFRPISGDGVHFGISPFPSGVVAFSRLLNDQEVLVVANTSTNSSFSGEVIVDSAITPDGALFKVLYSNQRAPFDQGNATTKPGGTVEIHEASGGVSHGPARVIRVQLNPMEVQILKV